MDYLTTRRNIQAGEVFTTDLRLVPRNPDGTVQGWARGDYSLVYKHPDDLHSTPIFDEVSLEFIWKYIDSHARFFREAVDWSWGVYPALSRTLHPQQ